MCLFKVFVFEFADLSWVVVGYTNDLHDCATVSTRSLATATHRGPLIKANNTISVSVEL